MTNFFFFNQELIDFQDPLPLSDMQHSLLHVGKNLIACNGKKFHFSTVLTYIQILKYWVKVLSWDEVLEKQLTLCFRIPNYY